MKTYLLGLMTVLFSLCAIAGEEKAVITTFVGTLKTGIVSIGGETTGVILTTKEGVVYELRFGKPELAALAKDFNGKAVSVTGKLQTVEGTEVKIRKIIDVTILKLAGKT